MKTVNDPIFGDMKYKYAWEKDIDLSLWGQVYPVKIVASDLDEVGITSKQRDAFSAVNGRYSDIITENEEAIRRYYNEHFGVETPSMPSVFWPQTIVFQRDGSWGILFDCSYDPEHGTVLYFLNDDVCVDSQDAFL